MFTDEHKRIVGDQLREQGAKPFARVLTPDVMARAAKRAAVAVGNSPLNVINLVWFGILGALNKGTSFTKVLVLTFNLLYDLEGFASTPLGQQTKRYKRPCQDSSGSKRKRKRRGKQGSAAPDKHRRRQRRSKHDPRGGGPTVSEEAYVKARKRMPMGYWLALIFVLVERFEEAHPGQHRWKGFRLLAMDGTTINLEQHAKLREYFGKCSNGHGKQKTQARMVMLQFPLVRLPCAYEVGPIKVGETTMALRLLSHVRANDLLLLDRGFWSYGLLARIHERGAFFGIRLKSNVKLQKVRCLGFKDEFVRWQPQRVRQDGDDLPEALEMRLIRYQVPGFRASALLTNATDPQRTTREDWVGMAAHPAVGKPFQSGGLYHRRWEIETTFRELKVTQGMEGSLRGRTPEAILFEIAAHVVTYLLVRLLVVEAAVAAGDDPLRLSFAGALHELKEMRAPLLISSAEHVQNVLLPRLLARIAEHKVPLRPGRHYPRPKDGKYKNKGRGRKQAPAKLQRKQG